jgi:hypothetical protein
MTGATIAIENAAASDTILSVKERVFAVNDKMPVRRQQLMYRPGPRGIEPLADDETLGGAGVAQDGSAELDVLLALTKEEAASFGQEVCWFLDLHVCCFSNFENIAAMNAYHALLKTIHRHHIV